MIKIVIALNAIFVVLNICAITMMNGGIFNWGSMTLNLIAIVCLCQYIQKTD